MMVFTLQRCIPDAKSIQQLQSNVLSKNIELSQMELNKINEIHGKNKNGK